MIIWFCIILILLAAMAAGFIIVPQLANQRFPRRVAVVLIISLVFPVFGLYYIAGNGQALPYLYSAEFIAQQDQDRALRPLVAEVKKETIRLTCKLQLNPQDWELWWQLAKLHMLKQEWQAATQAFNVAYTLNPTNVNLISDYVNAKLRLNSGVLDKLSHELLTVLLDNERTKPLANNFLAWDAYTKQDYRQAVNYWQIALNLLPVGQDNQQMRDDILQLIARAKSLF